MTAAILSADDLHALTGYRRPTRQRAALAAMGIRHYTRLDGRPIVAVADLAHARQGLPDHAEPNWSALSEAHCDPHPHPR